jgi:hypothetical protein
MSKQARLLGDPVFFVVEIRTKVFFGKKGSLSIFIMSLACG